VVSTRDHPSPVTTLPSRGAVEAWALKRAWTGWASRWEALKGRVVVAVATPELPDASMPFQTVQVATTPVVEVVVPKVDDLGQTRGVRVVVPQTDGIRWEVPALKDAALGQES
jgi:hypothetical protein